jgi:phosphoglycolate phosphatase
VLTNKNGEFARRLCAHLGLAPFLRGVFGADDTPWLKPQPELTAHVLAQLGADAAGACLVGDSPFDVATARNGGFPAFVVTTGTHTAAQLRAADAAGVYSTLAELGHAAFNVAPAATPA